MVRATARHILVKTEQACLDLKKQIEGGADFAALAKSHSQCPSGPVSYTHLTLPTILRV